MMYWVAKYNTQLNIWALTRICPRSLGEKLNFSTKNTPIFMYLGRPDAFTMLKLRRNNQPDIPTPPPSILTFGVKAAYLLLNFGRC